jgi:hypothetical protein
MNAGGIGLLGPSRLERSGNRSITVTSEDPLTGHLDALLESLS